MTPSPREAVDLARHRARYVMRARIADTRTVATLLDAERLAAYAYAYARRYDPPRRTDAVVAWRDARRARAHLALLDVALAPVDRADLDAARDAARRWHLQSSAPRV